MADQDQGYAMPFKELAGTGQRAVTLFLLESDSQTKLRLREGRRELDVRLGLSNRCLQLANFGPLQGQFSQRGAINRRKAS